MLFRSARNRAPGYHFAGHFLDLQCSRFERSGVEFSVEPGPHCTDAHGNVGLTALLAFGDLVLAASSRVYVDSTRRTATLLLRIEPTGEVARGTLHARARSDGFSPRTVLPEATCSGSIVAGGREVLRMSGTWVSPPAPPGRVLYPLPWEGGERGTDVALTRRELDAAEKDVVRRVEKAIRGAPHQEFLAGLWAPTVRHTPKGALGRLPVAMHVGNRVGHVQGGLLMSTALATATAAVPHHPVLTAASAWYISPGQGKAISARSTVLQKGRNVAVVRTELFATGGKRVLETISNHAIAAH